MEKNLEQRQHIDFNNEEFEEVWLNDQKILNKQNIITLRTYIEAGMCAEQLKNYKKYFADENIKILFLDDLKNDFRGTLFSLFQFLNVDTSITSDIKSEIKNTYNKNRLSLFSIWLEKK